MRERIHFNRQRGDRDEKRILFFLINMQVAGLSSKRQLFISLLIAFSVLTSGCGLVGPASLKEGRKRYNQVVAFTNSEQMLMNLVKLKYRDKPTFLLLQILADLQAGSTPSAAPILTLPVAR